MDTDTLRLRRLCALLVAIGYCCLSLMVPFHQHRDGRTDASSGALVVHSVSSITPSSNSQAAITSSLHCAACDWDAIVSSQAVHLFVIPPHSVWASLARTGNSTDLYAISQAAASRGPPSC
jgi:hypothetical protein